MNVLLNKKLVTKLGQVRRMYYPRPFQTWSRKIYKQGFPFYIKALFIVYCNNKLPYSLLPTR